MKIIVIAAHPDDEILGCGATISRLAQEGNDVFVAILGEGITSRYTNRNDPDKELIVELKEKAKEASEMLGVKELFLFDFPDNRFDTISLLEIVKKVEGLIDKIKPEIVFTHNGYDLNIDHVITHRAVLTATRPIFGCTVKELYTFEVSSSTEWSFGEFGSYNPDSFFDVENTIEKKIKAINVYDSEIRQFPHPRSSEAIKSVARTWGSVVGLEYAEAFVTVRRIVNEPQKREICGWSKSENSDQQNLEYVGDKTSPDKLAQIVEEPSEQKCTESTFFENKKIRIRKAILEDCEDIFRWKNDIKTRESSFDSTIISYEEHLKWYKQALTNDEIKFFIGEIPGGPNIGVIRFDRIDSMIYRVNVNVAPTRRCKGFGKLLITEASSFFKEKIIAKIKSDNYISVRAFQKSGYEEVSNVNGIIMMEYTRSD